MAILVLRILSAALLVTGVPVWAQVEVDPRRLPAEIRTGKAVANEEKLRCSVSVIKPELDFSFRFRAGYVVSVPLEQYEGGGHHWAIVAIVTPEGEESKPVYLMSSIRLPEVPKTKLNMEVGGGYLLGEGRYNVSWMLFDEQGRACRDSWKIKVQRSRGERDVSLAVPPKTVEELSFRRWRPAQRGAKGTDKLTVLLHAAPLYPRATRLRFTDRLNLVASLASLLEHLPSRSVHLIVFNLDQQKVVFDEGDFQPDDFDRVSDALQGLQLGTVNYDVLKNRRGHVDILTELLNRQYRADPPPDAVIFLGPASRYLDRPRESAFEASGEGGPQVFYFQNRPNWRRDAEFPDSIEHAVHRVKGKTVKVHTPGEFAEAIKLVSERLAAGKAGREDAGSAAGRNREPLRADPLSGTR